MSEKTRVRFAPSPTGFLHIGGARTALFNWLYARHNNGTFVLRIEDTDSARSTGEYINAITEGMKWLGLDWDEGPYLQSERFKRYKEYVDKLIHEDKAYFCTCSPEELESRRKEAMSQGKPVKYNGRCRNMKEPDSGEKAVVRFRMPQEGQTAVDDLIKGKVVFENSQLDDLIILRSDGTPTYNLTVVVDDIDMRINCVIRGDDHLNNTPKQIQFYHAFGYPLPKFAHLPMILGSDRTRLSKRHGAASVMAYYEMGYLPDALVNYLARLGWACGDQEIFSREELIGKFSLENIGSSSAVFNPEKLLWLNSRYIMNTDPKKLSGLVIPLLVKSVIVTEEKLPDEEWLSRAVTTLKERSKTLIELADSLRYYIADEVVYDDKAKARFLNAQNRDLLIQLKDGLTSLADFTVPEIEKVFSVIIKKNGIKLGKLAQPVRVAITGKTESPGIFEVLEIIGRDKTLKRLERAIETIKVS